MEKKVEILVDTRVSAFFIFLVKCGLNCFNEFKRSLLCLNVF